MTKKRIADLLKEEVEKPSASDTAARKRSAAKKPAPESSTAKSSAKTTAAKAKSDAASKSAASKTPAKTTAKSTTATKDVKSADTAALSKKNEQLQAELDKAIAQITALQEDVQTHQERVFELKDSLEKAESDGKKKAAQLEKATADLQEAKQTILKLSAAQQAKAEEAKAAAAKAQSQSQKQALSVQQSRRPSYKSIPEYAIQRGTPTGGQNNSMMSDDDIGWVD